MSKYRLKDKNVQIVLRRHGIVTPTVNEFTDAIAELILSDPLYSEAYGHNIILADGTEAPSVSKALANELIVEVDINPEAVKKSSARSEPSTSTSTEPKTDAETSSASAKSSNTSKSQDSKRPTPNKSKRKRIGVSKKKK